MQKLIASPRRKLVSLASSSKSPVPVSAAFVTFRFFFLPPRVVVVVSHCPLQRELRGSVLGVSQGEAGPLLSCRLCPSCLQATLVSTGVQRAQQAPLCLRASGPRNVAGHFVKQLGRGQARPWREVTTGLSCKKLIVDLMGTFTGVTRVACAGMRLSENENQMGCTGAEDQHTTCPKACLWGEGKTEVICVLKAHMLLYWCLFAAGI